MGKVAFACMSGSFDQHSIGTSVVHALSTRRNPVSNFISKIAADHFEGADEKFAVKSAGGTKEYDPLRDGPLRYLGYANECGCALF